MADGSFDLPKVPSANSSSYLTAGTASNLAYLASDSTLVSSTPVTSNNTFPITVVNSETIYQDGSFGLPKIPALMSTSSANAIKATGNISSSGTLTSTSANSVNTGNNGTLQAVTNRSNGNTKFDKMIARADPLLLFEFETIMPTLNTDSGLLTLPSEYVEDIEVPDESIEAGEHIIYGARKKTFAGDILLGEITVHLYAGIDFKAEQYLRAWKAMIINKQSVYGLPLGKDGYCKDIQVLVRFGTTVIGTYTLQATFPVSNGGKHFTSSSSERHVIDQTFICNGLIFTPEINAIQKLTSGLYTSNSNNISNSNSISSLFGSIFNKDMTKTNTVIQPVSNSTYANVIASYSQDY